jgi:hypothetical protein
MYYFCDMYKQLPGAIKTEGNPGLSPCLVIPGRIGRVVSRLKFPGKPTPPSLSRDKSPLISGIWLLADEKKRVKNKNIHKILQRRHQTADVAR